jgi:hypothetical protein
LDAISPDRFQDCFVKQDFVAEGEQLLAAKQQVHFGESESELFPFGEDVVSPGESPIKVVSKIFDVVLAGKLQIDQVDGRTCAAACSERDVQRF